jgi:3'(2'), 5'-bisphosphate nucleotidase
VSSECPIQSCSIADCSLRIPTKYSGGKEYQEKIWDHASGALLIAESGGICTDMFGNPLDFSIGRTLSGNEGIVAAGKDIHGQAVAAVKEAIEASKSG